MALLPQESVSTEAVVLRTWPCGETSAIASLLTRKQGFVKVLAKAARRPRSRLRALVEPGRLVNVEFSLDPRRELQFLRAGSVDLDIMTGGLGLEGSAFLLGALELVDRCRPAAVAARESMTEEMFSVCDAFIRMLSSRSGADPARVFFAFEWRFLSRHGLDPEISSCVVCGSSLAADLTREDEESTLAFSSAEGGVLCGACARQVAGRPLSREAYTEFQTFEAGAFQAGGTPPLARPLRRELGGHLHRFMGFHLPGYRLPAALELLRPVKIDHSSAASDRTPGV